MESDTHYVIEITQRRRGLWKPKSYSWRIVDSETDEVILKSNKAYPTWSEVRRESNRFKEFVILANDVLVEQEQF